MRARPSSRSTAALALLIVFTLWITWRAKAIEMRLNQAGGQISDLDGKPAPEFQLVSLDGRTVSAADFRGKKKLVVSFWASWCGPCRMELPQLANFYRRTHTDDSGYEIVAISIDDDPVAARTAATELKLPFPVLLDPSDKTSRLYGVNAIPALFVIGQDGKVLHGQAGYEMGFDFLLAQQLGIKDYHATGAPNAGSH